MIRKLFLTLNKKNKFKGNKIQILIHQQFLETIFKILFDWTEIVEENVELLKKEIEFLEMEIEKEIEKYTNDRTKQNIDSNLRLIENNDFFEELNLILKEKREILNLKQNEILKEKIISRNEKEYFYSCFFESLNFIDFSNNSSYQNNEGGVVSNKDYQEDISSSFTDKEKEINNVGKIKNMKSFLTSLLFCLKISIEYLDYEGKENIKKNNEIIDKNLNEIWKEDLLNLNENISNCDFSRRIFLIIFQNKKIDQNLKSSKKYFSKSFESKMMKRKSFGIVKEKSFEDRVKNKIKFQKQLSHHIGLLTISTLNKILNENEILLKNNSILREEFFEILMNLCRYNFSESVKIKSLIFLNDLFEKFDDKLSNQLKLEYKFEFLQLQDYDCYSKYVKLILKK